MGETRTSATARSPMATLWLGLDQPAIGDGILLMRQTFRLTRQQLIDRLAEASGHLDRGPDVSLVFKWERGLGRGGRRPRPRDDRRLLLAKVCEAEVERLDGLTRRTFLRRLTLLAGVPWLSEGLEGVLSSEFTAWRADPEGASAWHLRHGHVTPETVDAIRELTRTFRRLDNRLGGGYAQKLLAHHLDDQIMPMIRNGRYTEEVGQDLFSAAAELAHLAGWMAYDVELHVVARRYLNQALQLASAAADSGLGGEILAGLGHQAIYLGRITEAIDLAQAARQAANRARVPALLAEAYVLEAHGHARLGHAGSCATLLHRADKAFERVDGASAPEWIRYFDNAYLAARCGHCFRDLRDWSQAARFARRSLDMVDGFVRGRAFNTALLASVLIETDLDEAGVFGLEAVNLTRGIQSGRSLEYIRDLERRLQGRGSDPAIKAFREGAAELLR